MVADGLTSLMPAVKALAQLAEKGGRRMRKGGDYDDRWRLCLRPQVFYKNYIDWPQDLLRHVRVSSRRRLSRLGTGSYRRVTRVRTDKTDVFVVAVFQFFRLDDLSHVVLNLLEIGARAVKGSSGL